MEEKKNEAVSKLKKCWETYDFHGYKRAVARDAV
jgi:hypothetical protein